MSRAGELALTLFQDIRNSKDRVFTSTDIEKVLQQMRKETTEECANILDIAYECADKTSSYKPTAFLVIAKQIRDLKQGE